LKYGDIKRFIFFYCGTKKVLACPGYFYTPVAGRPDCAGRRQFIRAIYLCNLLMRKGDDGEKRSGLPGINDARPFNGFVAAVFYFRMAMGNGGFICSWVHRDFFPIFK